MRKRLTSLFLALFMVLTLTALNLTPAFAISGADAKAQARAYNRHSIGLTSVKNARELGGYKTKDGRTVKFGKLLRSGNLVNLNAADKKKLATKYKVKKDIDLRSLDDIDRDGSDVKIPGVKFVHLPYALDFVDSFVRSTAGLELAMFRLEDLASGKVDLDIVSAYYEAGYMHMYISEKGRKWLRSFFDQLLEANGDTVLFHCTAGKDRTGNCAMLLLSALGVDKKVILQDFLLTNYYFTDDRQELYDQVYGIVSNKKLAQDISSFMGVKKKWLLRSYDVIESHYGSVDGFLKKGLGLTSKDIKKLQKAYLQ